MGNPLKTITYTYGDSSWGDLLTAYNGKAITYDGIGNPLTYNGWTYAWEHGRELASMTKSSTTWTYTYDANGMRTSRSNGTTTYTYVYNGNQLVQMSDGTNVLYFTYNANGHPMTVTLNGTLYYYITNLQGDVVSIATPANEYLCEYIYDAWGNLRRTFTYYDNPLITLNPLLYRGYVYDRETQLYYLQSRYYNPEWGRFLNADRVYDLDAGLQGYNIFLYCANNPVNRIDISGANSTTLEEGTEDILDAMTLDGGGQLYNTSIAGNGSGSMIGDIAYINNKNTGSGSTSTSFWNTLISKFKKNNDKSSNKSKQSSTPQHTSGTTSPKNVSNPNGSYTQLDSNGRIYSYTQYDSLGRQNMRIDFQGRPHAGALPHIHIYKYLELGGRADYIFDLNWHLLN